MIEEIRSSMRITHRYSDEEILRNIDTCKIDMRMAGVYGADSDELIRKACELYVKWQFDYEGKGERFEKAYRSLKDAMALCGDYNVRQSNQADKGC